MFTFLPPRFREVVDDKPTVPSNTLLKRYSTPIMIGSSKIQHASSFSPPNDKELADMHESNQDNSPGRQAAEKPAQSSSNGPDLERRNSRAELKDTQGEGTFDFEKIEVVQEDVGQDRPSALSQLVAKAATTTHRVRCINLRVFLPCYPPGSTKSIFVKLPIRVQDTCSVTDVIANALQRMQEEQAKFPEDKRMTFNPNPDVYKLRVAEEDGTPDEDLPPLDKKTSLSKGFETLVMCIDKEGRDGDFDQEKRFQNVTTLEDLTFLVHLGQERSKSKKMSFPPDVVYRDLLGVISERLGRDPKKFQLKLVVDGIDQDNLPENISPADKTLKTLRKYFGVSELSLRKIAGLGDLDDEKSDEGDEDQQEDARGVLYTEYDASKYQEFHVIKINKYGTRQERLLGIDREKIYNMLPKEVKSRITGSVKRTMYPERAITDIESIKAPDLARPCYFEIEYKHNQTPRDRIEARSKREAQEIIMKIQFLLQLHNPETRPVKRQPVQDKRASKFIHSVSSIVQALSDVSGDVVEKVKSEIIPSDKRY
eukprot:TRINITY_DN1051_c0_g1_i1.p1 TRINITY_DN1051_c0_g1~~TRINITY_DN1051_c0_g1_i1.p1  ORF type:complete len:539 (-),score=106.06 TRINITY_DN1051_c0_g1_i1:862-2478(-)